MQSGLAGSRQLSPRCVVGPRGRTRRATIASPVGTFRRRAPASSRGGGGYTRGLPSDYTPRHATTAMAPDGTDVEAARYVLFGRILPALRHALVGELQALRFGVGIVRASSSPAEVETALRRLADQTARSIAHSDAITRWYQPDPEASVAAEDAIRECLELVHGDWQLRGISAAPPGGADAARVHDRGFREVLMACLLALGDELTRAADVTLKVRHRGGALWVTLRAEPVDRDGELIRAPFPRRVNWSDAEALAAANSVALKRRGRRIAARFAVTDAGP